MICLDTTVLIDEFRAGGSLKASVNRSLLEHGGESLIVPVVAAGEFLDGAAMISEERLQQAMRLMRTRRLAPITLEVAEHYGRIVSTLRRRMLGGRSHNDLWIAATSRSYGARLLTRNPADFGEISGLDVISYSWNQPRRANHSASNRAKGSGRRLPLREENAICIDPGSRSRPS